MTKGAPITTVRFAVTDADRRRQTWRQYRRFGAIVVAPTALCLIFALATRQAAFVGGAVAFVAQVLLLAALAHRTTRRGRRPPTEWTVEVFDDRIRWSSAGAMVDTHRHQLVSSGLTKAGLVITARGRASLIPRSAFASEGTLMEFAAHVRRLAPELHKPSGFQSGD